MEKFMEILLWIYFIGIPVVGVAIARFLVWSYRNKDSISGNTENLRDVLLPASFIFAKDEGYRGITELLLKPGRLLVLRATLYLFLIALIWPLKCVQLFLLGLYIMWLVPTWTSE